MLAELGKGRMKVVFAFAVSTFLLLEASHSQAQANDWGVRDTLALVVSVPPVESSRSPLVIEAWVYSDETVLSYSAGFAWDNRKLHIDSAFASPLIDGPQYQIFLFDEDDLTTSNVNQTFVLGGLSSGAGIPGDFRSRRLWATYYFTIENWQPNDTLAINILPDSQMELAFVSPGPFYPVKYRPYFGGPMLFPGIATLLEGNENALTLPDAVTLHQNYPNPFNPETTIEFEMPRRGHIELEIFNSLGQKVTTLVNAELAAGVYRYNWSAVNKNGAKVPSGVYFYRLKMPDFVTSKKMILIE